MTSECASSVVAGDVLHDEVAVLRLDHRVEDFDDVRMAEFSGERGLGEERLVHHALGLGVDILLEEEHLDRDFPVEKRVVRKVHAAGRTAADLTDDRVLPEVLSGFELRHHLLLEDRASLAVPGVSRPSVPVPVERISSTFERDYGFRARV